MNTYFNTVGLRGEELKQRRTKAESQNEVILKLFQDNPTSTFTPFEVWERFNRRWPITSIRRSMTSLTIQERLYKTKERRKGLFNDLNYAWTLNTA